MAKSTMKKVEKFVKKNGGKILAGAGTTITLGVGAIYGNKKGIFSKGLDLAKGIFNKVETSGETLGE
jgi:hypothetical protein